VVRWRTGVASCEEVAALRRLLPALRARPASDVFREARGVTEWVVATCEPYYARQIRGAAERAGLVAMVEPVPPPDLRTVDDDEVVAELAAGGRDLTDFFLLDGLVCSVNVRGELLGRRIDDEALAAAIKAYLRQVGAREYASYQEFLSSPRPEGPPGPSEDGR
jgi:hypothetical protein